MYADLYGNGKPGIKSVLENHVTMYTTRENEKKIYDDRMEAKSNTIRNWLMAGFGLLAAILGLLTYLGLKPSNKSFLKSQAPVYASVQVYPIR